MIKKRNKILHVTYSLNYGGIQQVLLTLVRYSKQSSYEHIIATPCLGPLTSAYEEAGAKIILAPQDEISSSAQELKVDVVMTHTVNGSNPWEHRHVYQLLKNRIPLINYSHCNFPCQSPIDIFDALITESQNNWKVLGKPAQAEIIPHGIDFVGLKPNKTAEQIKNSFGIPLRSLVIGRISRIEDSKLISETIKTMARIKKMLQNPITFVIAGGESDYVIKELGEGMYLKGLKLLSKHLGLTSKDLIFLGPLSEQQKANLLECIDIYLAPSSMEGYGIVFCEAMARGIPVVTYDNAANKETIGPGGLVVEFGDLSNLVSSTLSLINNEELRSRIGEQGRQLVSKRNAPDLYAQRIESLINRTLLSQREKIKSNG